MLGRVTALVLAMAAASTAAAQPLAPATVGRPSDDRPSPAAFLLSPVASPRSRSEPSTDSRDRPRDRDDADRDLPPVAPTRSEPRSTPAEVEPPRTPAARLTRPRDVVPVSAEVIESGRPTRRNDSDRPPSGEELFDYLSDSGRRTKRTGRDDDKPSRTRSDSWRFGDRIHDLLEAPARRGWFCSDHAFDCLVSPVTNPFLFEDPRALTEVRPIVIYQNVPSQQPNFRGGHMWYFGTQARVAFTERLSLTVNKLGATLVDPAGFSPYNSREIGFSELWLGPKYTFIRDEEFGTLLAGGVLFQIPIGSGSVYQNTGSLSITPYVSVAQPFFKSRFGAFNTMANVGYSFSTDKQRSDYLHASAHVDYDVGNAHRFFPLAELNWFQYTTDGQARFIKGEGRDLINFGSLGDGSSLVTGALGAKFKPTKNTEVGAAFEMPLVGNNDFFQYRFTIDFIWRY